MSTYFQGASNFTASEMTDAVNKLPVSSTLMSSHFERAGVRTTSIELEIQQGQITLISDKARDAPESDVTSTHQKRTLKSIRTNYLPQVGIIKPEDVQDVRAFGTTEPVGFATIVNDKMQRMKQNLAMTLEYHRIGAIKGMVMDADGVTPLHNLYDYFEVTKKTQKITFPKNASTSDTISTNINMAVRQLEAGMGGNYYTGIECICGAEFYDALTQHSLVKEYFYDWLVRHSHLGDNNMRNRMFPFAGVKFYEASKVVGGKTQVDTRKAHMYPTGAGIYKTYHAPANWGETVNTIGLEYYARIDDLPYGKGKRIEVQSSPCTLCLFPEALVELSMA